MVMEAQAPGPVPSNSSTSKTVPDTRINQLPPLDNSMAIQSSSMAVSSAPQSKPVDTDPATGTPVKPNSHTLGYEFVRQYYTMLNKAPGSVHRFYAEDSSFIHGSLNDSIQSEPVYGQLKINERITALNFKDCHAKIVQVDSLGTVGDGFVIQVTGELSNDGQPMRRFFQTFVLVPRGPNNYYVRNDIFRYQDELFADEEEVSEAEEAEVIRSSASAATSNTIAEAIAPIASSDPSAGAVPAVDPPSSHISSDSAGKLPREEARGPTEKASTAVSVDKSPKGSVKVNGYQEQKLPTGTQVSSEQKQQQQSPSVGPSQQKLNKSSQVASGNNNTSVTPVTTSSAVVSSSSSSVVQSEKAPVSWAAKVARDTVKPSLVDGTSNATVTNTLLSPPKASKEQPQQVHNTSPAGHQQQAHHQAHPHQQQQQQAQQQSHPHNQQQNAHQPQQQQHSQQSGRKGGDRVAKTPKVDKDESNTLNEGDSVGNENNHEVIKKISPYNDEQQVFVGNLPLDIKEEDLKVFFSKFGNILDVRINRTNQTSGSGRTPNYGFVTFDDAKVVRNILSQKPIYFNEHRFNVEEKRSQGRGSALNRSASGATLGVSKGPNQQHNQQQNSHQARRERRDRFPFQGNREAGPRRNQTAGGSAGAPVMAGQTRPVFQPKR